MKTVTKILVGLVVVVLLVVVIAAAVVDSKYHAIRASLKVPRQTYADPNASVRVSVAPPLAIDLIRPLLEKQGVPAWVVDKVLPYEGAVFLTPDMESRRFGVRIGLNEQRLGPVIAQVPAQVGLSRQAPFVQWTSEVMTSTKRGEMSLDGVLDIPALGAEGILKYWGKVYQLTRPELEGGHLLEAVIDNRDGSLFALLATLDSNNSPKLGIPLADMAKALLPIATIRVTGDLDSPDKLELKLVVDCRPETEDSVVSTTDFQIGMALGAAAKQLKEKYGVDLTGRRKKDGQTIVGDYALVGLQKLL